MNAEALRDSECKLKNINELNNEIEKIPCQWNWNLNKDYIKMQTRQILSKDMGKSFNQLEN